VDAKKYLIAFNLIIGWMVYASVALAAAQLETHHRVLIVFRFLRTLMARGGGSVGEKVRVGPQGGIRR
jgi:hypothetical protein